MRTVHQLIAENTTLPVSKEQFYATIRDDQTQMMLTFYQDDVKTKQP